MLTPRPEARLACLVLGLGSLYLPNTPAASAWLRGQLEIYPPVALEHGTAVAIVVLGADRRRDAPEYGGDTIGGFGLERLRYAAWLHKKTGLPVLVSGDGSTQDEVVPEAIPFPIISLKPSRRVYAFGASGRLPARQTLRSKFNREDGSGRAVLSAAPGRRGCRSGCWTGRCAQVAFAPRADRHRG